MVARKHSHQPQPATPQPSPAPPTPFPVPCHLSDAVESKVETAAAAATETPEPAAAPTEPEPAAAAAANPMAGMAAQAQELVKTAETTVGSTMEAAEGALGGLKTQVGSATTAVNSAMEAATSKIGGGGGAPAASASADGSAESGAAAPASEGMGGFLSGIMSAVQVSLSCPAAGLLVRIPRNSCVLCFVWQGAGDSGSCFFGSKLCIYVPVCTYMPHVSVDVTLVATGVSVAVFFCLPPPLGTSSVAELVQRCWFVVLSAPQRVEANGFRSLAKRRSRKHVQKRRLLHAWFVECCRP